MATRHDAKQDTNKPQEQTKPPDQQPKHPEQSRPNETGVTPYRGGAPARPGGREPLSRLRDEFDRLFDQLTRGMFGVPDAGWGLDVREDEKTVTVRAEAPGFEASDFDVQVHGDRLVMRASRRSEEEEEGYRGWRRNEFSEALMLPAEVDADKVTAAYRNGVLTVTLPKSEQGSARRVKVEG